MFVRHAILSVCLFGGAFFAGEAAAQASTQASGSVTIVDPSALAQDTALAVGPVRRPAGSAAITSQATSGRYSVTGLAGDTFTVDMPRSLRLVRSGSTEEIVLQITPSDPVGTLGGAYGARSQASFGVQGAVSVSGKAAAGAYEGTFPVILTLQ